MRIGVVFLVLASALAAFGTGRVEADLRLTRKEVVNRLQHDEGLIQTITCEFEHRLLVTSPEQIDRITRVYGKGRRGADRYIIRPAEALDFNRSSKFWRKGIKQREEMVLDRDASANPDPYILAFDGSIVRQLGPGNGRPRASLHTPEHYSWGSSPRYDPVTFLYSFYEVPFSQVVSEATQFSAESLRRGSEQCQRVTVSGSGPAKGFVLDFVFDSHLRQVERIIKLRPPKGRLIWNHKYVFSNYRPHPTPTGETIWFPELVSYTGYDNQLEPFEVRWEQFRIKKIEFNLDVPDKLFELEIPKNAEVYDGITGMGWLKQGERPAALFPAEARTRRIWTAIAVLTALAVLTAGAFYARKRRRSAPGNA